MLNVESHVTSLAFSDTVSRFLAVATEGKGVMLCDVEKKNYMNSFEDHEGSVYSVVWNGPFLLTGTGTLLSSFHVFRFSSFISLSLFLPPFSPPPLSQLIESGGSHGEIFLHDVRLKDHLIAQFHLPPPSPSQKLPLNLSLLDGDSSSSHSSPSSKVIITSLKWSSHADIEKKFFASLDSFGRLFVWERSSSSSTTTTTTEGEEEKKEEENNVPLLSLEHSLPFTSFGWSHTSPDILAAADTDGSVTLWKIEEDQARLFAEYTVPVPPGRSSPHPIIAMYWSPSLPPKLAVISSPSEENYPSMEGENGQREPPSSPPPSWASVLVWELSSSLNDLVDQLSLSPVSPRIVSASITQSGGDLVTWGSDSFIRLYTLFSLTQTGDGEGFVGEEEGESAAKKLKKGSRTVSSTMDGAVSSEDMEGV